MPPDLEPASALPAIDMTPVDHPKSPAEEFALKLLTESWVDETGQHDRRVMARLIQEAELAIRADEREPLERRIVELTADAAEVVADLKHTIWIHEERLDREQKRIASLEAQLASALPWVREGLEHASTEQEARALVGSIEALLTSPPKSPSRPTENRCGQCDGTGTDYDVPDSCGTTCDVCRGSGVLPELPPPAAQKEPHGR